MVDFRTERHKRRIQRRRQLLTTFDRSRRPFHWICLPQTTGAIPHARQAIMAKATRDVKDSNRKGELLPLQANLHAARLGPTKDSCDSLASGPSNAENLRSHAFITFARISHGTIVGTAAPNAACPGRVKELLRRAPPSRPVWPLWSSRERHGT